MDDQITVYQKPTCSKCRELDRYLRESNVPFEKVNYYIEPLTEEKLRDLLAKMKLAPQDLLRKREPLYRELKLDQHNFSDDQLIALMIEHPDLMQRPIIERGSRAVLGRPIENVKAVLHDE
jgi:arsenate reductase